MKGRYASVLMSVYGAILPGAGRLARLPAEPSAEAKRRLKIIQWYEGHGKKVRLTARHFGYSPDTISRWVKGYKAGGVRGHRPAEPKWADRDRFVMSKGHAAPALYATLAEAGYFPTEWLTTLRRLGSPLQGHVDMKRTPGVETSAGSLGQGLSIAVGMAERERLEDCRRILTCAA